MSTYDILKMVCPACGTENLVQTKVGDCQMVTYEVSDAPPVILADISDRGPQVCDICGALYRLRVTVHSVVERC